MNNYCNYLEISNYVSYTYLIIVAKMCFKLIALLFLKLNKKKFDTAGLAPRVPRAQKRKIFKKNEKTTSRYS